MELSTQETAMERINHAQSDLESVKSSLNQQQTTENLQQALDEVGLNLLSVNGLLRESISIVNLCVSLQLYANSLIRFQKCYDMAKKFSNPPILPNALSPLILSQKITLHYTIARMVFDATLLEHPFNTILPCTKTLLNYLQPNHKKTVFSEIEESNPNLAAKKLDALFASSDKKAEILFIALNKTAVIHGMAYQTFLFCDHSEKLLRRTILAINGDLNETKDTLKEFAMNITVFHGRFLKLPESYRQALANHHNYFKINAEQDPINSPSKKTPPENEKFTIELPEIILYFMNTILQATLELPHDKLYQKTAYALQFVLTLFNFKSDPNHYDIKTPAIVEILKSDSDREAYAQIVAKHLQLFNKHFVTMKFILENRDKVGVNLAQLSNTLSDLMPHATALSQLLCGKHQKTILDSAESLIEEHFPSYDARLLAILHNAFQPLRKHTRYKHLPITCERLLEISGQLQFIHARPAETQCEQTHLLTSALCQHISDQLFEGDAQEQDSIKRIFSTLYTIDQLPKKFLQNAPKAFAYIRYIESAILKFYYFISSLPESYQTKIKSQLKEKNLVLGEKNLYIAIFKYFYEQHHNANDHPFVQGGQLLYHVIDQALSTNSDTNYQKEDIQKIAQRAKPFMQDGMNNTTTKGAQNDSMCTIL